VFKFVPWSAASAPGSTTPGLNVREVSDSVQEKVPGAIIVEGKACTPKGALHVNVYVLAPDKKPLMPTTPRRARVWLKQKKARIVNRTPFTIQLRFEPSSRYAQHVRVGVDTGSKTVGVAAVAHSKVLYQAEISLRTEIRQSMDHRRQYRRKRRNRHTRYRPVRFNNRKRSSGWLAPSLRSKADSTVRAVVQVAAILPVKHVRMEVASFDTQQMQAPEISGIEYQQGELAGYHVREYLLAKWGRKCAYCGRAGLPLEVEHIVPRIRGGTHRVSNLTLACKTCNQSKGKRTAEEFGYPEVQARALKPLRDAVHVSIIKTWVIGTLASLLDQVPITTTYGYETKYKRLKRLELPKTHYFDAVAIACELGETVVPGKVWYQYRCVARGRYQLYNGSRSEHKVSGPKKVCGWKLFELVNVNGHVGYISGRRVSGRFSVKDAVTGKLLVDGIGHKKLVRLARAAHGSIVHMNVVQ
jgi:5-methylcytosine-specific restriction endonuclease McrA